MDMIPISKFKATCLAVLEEVRRSGNSVLITRRGEVIAEVVPAPRHDATGSRLGALRGTGRIVGDLIEPAVPAEEWEVNKE